MTEQELEQALREALPPLNPQPDLSAQIMARIDTNSAQRADGGRATVAASMTSAPSRRIRVHRGWLPAAIAAGALIAFGLAQWAQLQRERQLEAQAQLMQGLTIASASLHAARTIVLHSDDSTR